MEPEFKTKLVETYNRYAGERDKHQIVDWKIKEWANFVALLQEKQKRSILEIGAGPGKDSRFFRESGFEVISTDSSPAMVKLCRQKNLAAIVADFYNPGFAAEQFEAIWALNCLLHVPKKDLPSVLQGLKAVLKPTGLFYLGSYGGYDFEGIWPDDPYTPQRFYSFYPDQQIQAIAAEFFELLYFKAIFVEGRGFHFQSMILKK